MSFAVEALLDTLDRFKGTAGAPGRYLVAYSGGLDSTVLLHALAISSERHCVPLMAVHVDHGLQHESAVWTEHCAAFAAARDVEFVSRRVVVDPSSGQGLEAAAREARYAALRNIIEPGDWLLSAHHQDDQAETVLLNLMRASGPAGLAGISALRRFAAGWLVRPLLAVSRRDLQAYADRHSLSTISDPSNFDQQFDRNYLRHEVLPRLDARWPDVARRIRRSGTLAREAAGLLEELADNDLQTLGTRADRLSLTALGELSPARQRNVLRHAILSLGLPIPGAVHLEKLQSDVIDAREDAQPLLAWPGARARRYRDHLYLLPADDLEPVPADTLPISSEHLPLPGGLGVLVFEPGAPEGLSDAVMGRRLSVRFRDGGEEIKQSDQQPTKKLKKLLQESAIVPWMRDRLPLVYSDDALVAVADLWTAAAATSRPGTAVRWVNRPALH